MASVRDIAAKARVSVATVSRALNDKPNVDAATRDRVLAAARQIGYVKSAPVKVSDVVALAYPGEIVRADYGAFDSSLIFGILRGLNAHRFDMTILNISRDRDPREDYRSFFARKGVKGVILRSFEDSREACEAIAEEGFPSVVVADRFDNPKVNFICTESRSDSRRAVEHLIRLGHQRIALGVHFVRDTDHRDRCEGYREALEDNGVKFDPRLLVDLVADMSGGANAVRYLMELPDRPTAVFFTDPMATLGAMHACRDLGIHVPQDLSIVGFDDSDVRYHAFPPFTAVCQDASLLGYESARWLLRRINGESQEPLRSVRPTSFEINQTTSVPPSQRAK
jgi:LacI family transcriptional regulator